MEGSDGTVLDKIDVQRLGRHDDGLLQASRSLDLKWGVT